MEFAHNVTSESGYNGIDVDVPTDRTTNRITAPILRYGDLDFVFLPNNTQVADIDIVQVVTDIETRSTVPGEGRSWDGYSIDLDRQRQIVDTVSSGVLFLPPLQGGVLLRVGG